MNMKTIKIILGAIILSSFVQCSSPKSVAETENAPKTENVIKKQIKESAMIVDVRTPKEFAEGSFKGAINIPLDEVESRIDEFKNQKNIIIFCRSGKRSEKAIGILANNGITNVTNGINQQNLEENMK